MNYPCAPPPVAAADSAETCLASPLAGTQEPAQPLSLSHKPNLCYLYHDIPDTSPAASSWILACDTSRMRRGACYPDPEQLATPRHSHFQHHWHCLPTSSLVSCSIFRTSSIPTCDAVHIDEAHGCLRASQPGPISPSSPARLANRRHGDEHLPKTLL